MKGRTSSVPDQGHGMLGHRHVRPGRQVDDPSVAAATSTLSHPLRFARLRGDPAHQFPCHLDPRLRITPGRLSSGPSPPFRIGRQDDLATLSREHPSLPSQWAGEQMCLDSTTLNSFLLGRKPTEGTFLRTHQRDAGNVGSLLRSQRGSVRLDTNTFPSFPASSQGTPRASLFTSPPALGSHSP
jgi:hypothetical protein